MVHTSCRLAMDLSRLPLLAQQHSWINSLQNLANRPLGRGPSLLASIFSVVAFDFFFTDPRFTMVVSDTQYIITFLGLFIVSVAISTLAGRVREHVEAIHAQEQQSS